MMEMTEKFEQADQKLQEHLATQQAVDSIGLDQPSSSSSGSGVSIRSPIDLAVERNVAAREVCFLTGFKSKVQKMLDVLKQREEYLFSLSRKRAIETQSVRRIDDIVQFCKEGSDSEDAPKTPQLLRKRRDTPLDKYPEPDPFVLEDAVVLDDEAEEFFFASPSIAGNGPRMVPCKEEVVDAPQGTEGKVSLDEDSLCVQQDMPEDEDGPCVPPSKKLRCT
eukprot:gnl/MRDRNA2_/MRDRNA2_117657_c0_seq1.p1 gnl/MRDRNA2_/MRDRNA2_117657_c0~~gnl/MRDRNA2_/MRDRNA2_117657_c0_seq1.p1  ORF type:complete len:221 (+),score=55.18 gnl/MRDRNA2_/MRDRNA2_117657_c0_seq1:57-719(+)